MLFLIWCVFGGFLLYFFESVFLESLLKPNYEKPVDTAQDVFDRGLTVIIYPGAWSMIKLFKNSPSAVVRKLGERTIAPKVIFCYFDKFYKKCFGRIGMNTMRWFSRR